MTGSHNVKNWKALNSGHLRQKLQRARAVITNRLLGHKPDYNTSKTIIPFCNTFYENMTNLSRFQRTFCGMLTKSQGEDENRLVNILSKMASLVYSFHL
jgi:exopolysaccharide biosynthesis predicted pyruvyltransferase EpsI